MRYERHGWCGKCGVYLITCLVNGKRYVGSSVDVCRRTNQHFGAQCLKRYGKSNPFYEDIHKYGRDNFKVEVLEFCTPEEKIAAETKWFERLKPEYNVVRPDENSFSNEAVQERVKRIQSSPTGAEKRLNAHQSEHCRERCRDVQRKRMRSCKSTDADGNVQTFESLCAAVRWLNRESKPTCVISKIKAAAARNGTAYGYRWEVV